jgi:hypothetical protein
MTPSLRYFPLEIWLPRVSHSRKTLLNNTRQAPKLELTKKALGAITAC